jgi:hypothetical protein
MHAGSYDGVEGVEHTLPASIGAELCEMHVRVQCRWRNEESRTRRPIELAEGRVDIALLGQSLSEAISGGPHGYAEPLTFPQLRRSFGRLPELDECDADTEMRESMCRKSLRES